jgi:hypothetical protein
MNKLSTMLFQVVTVEQRCNNMLTILFIVGRTTLFTPVDINLEQVVDFLNSYACIYFYNNCLTVFILTHPVNFPCGRKPKHPKKTHDFRQLSVDWLFSHESVARIKPTNSEAKRACSDNFHCGRKPEHPEKTHDFCQSVDRLFSHESVARIQPTRSQRWMELALTTPPPKPLRQRLRSLRRDKCARVRRALHVGSLSTHFLLHLIYCT